MLSVTPVTSTTLTVTVAVAFNPLLVVAVMVAVPSPFAVTVPPLTVATDASLDVHTTFLLVASEGATVAVSFTVSFRDKSADVLSRVTPVGSIFTISSSLPPDIKSLKPSIMPGAGVLAVFNT